ncbi:glycosyltransferase [Pontibacter ramchanderi]|uniref:Glycosyltransferase involved in cell wall biosynthesis n=1 Tax=Pontibacter ramchanderi TaxID=1179743 RepID=A0A2N3U7Q5_9BACT|nr:glycosyltransferase [Pontibacter ramchanderi]PKV62782.1 glycosyltransferase involved in cell wall biosynthesis [Pontibacter ramchanderi]
MLTYQDTSPPPLVSVVIPCYNHGNYVRKAIESVIKQTYSRTEIIVVDDGSTDDTKDTVERYAGVRYIYQENQGLSAARNTGAKYSTGNYIMFLDSDDWLYPKGIETNVNYLIQHSEVAFVSGIYDAFYVDENTISEGKHIVDSDHYYCMLQGNYIGMIATVLFQQWVFKEFSYDTSLRNCEDYDLYLKITRKYQVYHHQNKIAAYRLHAKNMSSNIPLMLAGALHVLKRQENQLKTMSEREAYLSGIKAWKEHYCKKLYLELIRSRRTASHSELRLLFEHHPRFLSKYILNQGKATMKAMIKRFIPATTSKRLLNRMGLYKKFTPRVGQVDFGDFNRVLPFSNMFGYDRGGPIDRYYIEKFLNEEKDSIKGRMLEIGDNAYTLRFGGSKIVQSDVLHVNGSNEIATIIGDISHAPHIQDNTFDGIILTQTLHLIYDFKGALNTCHRILKPGGTLLLTVPGITPIDQGEWNSIWYWSFTDKSMKKLMQESFPNCPFEVKTFGNVLAASTFLHGMGRTEIPQEKLDFHDPQYQVIICVKVQKSTAP